MTAQFVKSLLGDQIPNNKTCSRMDILEWWNYLESKSPIEKKTCPIRTYRVCERSKIRRESWHFCAVCEYKPSLCVVYSLKSPHSITSFGC